MGVEPIMVKMVESHLKWIGHIWRKPIEASVRRIDQIEGNLIVKEREI